MVYGGLFKKTLEFFVVRDLVSFADSNPTRYKRVAISACKSQSCVKMSVKQLACSFYNGCAHVGFFTTACFAKYAKGAIVEPSVR